MGQCGLTLTVILLLVIVPHGQQSPPIEPILSATIHAAGLTGPLLLQLDDPATYSLTNGESTEEQQGYTGYSYYAPSTMNFHDLYSNNLALLAEERVSTSTARDDESYHLNNVPSHFVEFHPKTPPTTTLYPIDQNANTTSSTSTTEEPEENSIKVLPLRKQPPRGVLDLLFPSSRVKTFKAVFDTFRRMMSNTF